VTTVLSDLAEIASAYRLVEVIAYEHSGRRESPALEAESEQEMSALVRREAGVLETRFRMTVRTRDAEMRSDVGAVFSSSEGHEVAAEAVGEFINQVGIMVVYPYLREGVFTSASRLGVSPPVLDLVRRGEISFSSEPDQGGSGT